MRYIFVYIFLLNRSVTLRTGFTRNAETNKKLEEESSESLQVLYGFG